MAAPPAFAPPIPALSRSRSAPRTARAASSSSSSSPPLSSRPHVAPRLAPRASVTSSASASAPPSTKSKPAPPTRRTKPSPVRTVTHVQLQSHLSQQTPTDITVVKCYADYCRSCKGVEAKFRKLALAYSPSSSSPSSAQSPPLSQSDVHFYQIDFAHNEQFCRDRLGVSQLPFFGIFRGGRYVGGEAIGWQRVTSRLARAIDGAMGAEQGDAEATAFGDGRALEHAAPA